MKLKATCPHCKEVREFIEGGKVCAACPDEPDVELFRCTTCGTETPEPYLPDLGEEYDDEPLPCPFCGGEPVVDDYGTEDDPFWQVACEECEIMIPADGDGILSRENAIAVWNRRKG